MSQSNECIGSESVNSLVKPDKLNTSPSPNQTTPSAPLFAQGLDDTTATKRAYLSCLLSVRWMLSYLVHISSAYLALTSAVSNSAKIPTVEVVPANIRILVAIVAMKY